MDQVLLHSHIHNTSKSECVGFLFVSAADPIQHFAVCGHGLLQVLDHVLHNKLNSTDEEKELDAYAFAKQYRNDVDAFVKFICESDFSVVGEYPKTWQFIKEEKHSLERYTNFGICLKKDNYNGIPAAPNENA